MTYIYDGKEYSEGELNKLIEKPSKHLTGRTKKSLQLVEGDRILDIGCGIGIIAHLLAEKHKEVVGIDLLPESIKIAKAKCASQNITFEVGDVMKLRYKDNSFDCVVFLEVIEHVENPMKALSEIWRVLRPGGYLVLSTPNGASYIRFIYGLLPDMKRRLQLIKNEPRNTGTEKDHIYSWDVYTLSRLLDRCGFEYVGHAFSSVHGLGPFKRLGEMGFLEPLFGRFCANIILKVRKRT